MRSQKPEELFDAAGKLRPELKELAPAGTRRMSANPHANGGILKRALRLPDFRSYGSGRRAARQNRKPKTRARSACSCAT